MQCDVAIRILYTLSDNRTARENGLPHQSADWFAMTGGFDTWPHLLCCV